MRQVVLLDLHDLANLRRGQPLIIQTGNGQAVEINYDGKRADLPVASKPAGGQWTYTGNRTALPKATDSAPPSPPPSAKKPPPPKKSRCPYCKATVRTTALGAHVRHRHPDKGLVATGGVKCRWCAKRYPNSRSSLRHEMMKHLAEYRAQIMKKGNGA